MIIKQTAAALALAVLILAISAGLKYAQGLSLLEAETVRRSMQILFGLTFAAYANLMPKQLGRPMGSAMAEARAQSALRFGGWSMAVAGLAYAALWAFAPLAFADDMSLAVVATAIAVTFGYALWSFMLCRTHSQGSST